MLRPSVATKSWASTSISPLLRDLHRVELEEAGRPLAELGEHEPDLVAHDLFHVLRADPAHLHEHLAQPLLVLGEVLALQRLEERGLVDDAAADRMLPKVMRTELDAA